MPTEHTFFGKVHPERCVVSLGPVEAAVEFRDGEVRGNVHYSISLSQIHAVLTTDEPIANSETARNVVEAVIRMGVDSLGYTLGCGYDLEITQMVAPHLKRPVVFGIGIDSLKSLAINDGVEFEAILKALVGPGGRYLSRCLADLREAIRVPSDSAFFCYRAIESLRQYFVTGKKLKTRKNPGNCYAPL